MKFRALMTKNRRVNSKPPGQLAFETAINEYTVSVSKTWACTYCKLNSIAVSTELMLSSIGLGWEKISPGLTLFIFDNSRTKWVY